MRETLVFASVVVLLMILVLTVFLLTSFHCGRLKIFVLISSDGLIIATLLILGRLRL